MELQQRSVHVQHQQQPRGCQDVAMGNRSRASQFVTCSQTPSSAGSRRSLEQTKFDSGVSVADYVYHRQHTGYRQKLNEERTFYCRMLVARTCRRSMASGAPHSNASGCHEHKVWTQMSQVQVRQYAVAQWDIRCFHF
jgi:hypothetical protein